MSDAPQPSPWAQSLPQTPQMQGLPAQAQDVHDLHDQSVAHYNALKKIYNRLDAVRTGLGNLVKMADTVTAEDVVDEAAKFLHKGFSSVELASVLADMPAQGGEALSGWLKQQVAQAQANEAKLAPALQAARHQMGVSAMHSILGHQLDDGPKGAPEAPNPLMPQGGQQ